MLKWMFDRVAALLLIIVLMPIMLIVALLLLVTSDWPVFFVQERIGQYGKKFNMVKFKTMRGPENSPIAVIDNNRVTSIGKWLRRTKIDELPELFNILIGTMSFVGPRPDVPGYADKLIGDDRVILSLKPGLTGLASLKYRNEDDILAVQPDPLKDNDEVIWPDKVRINKIYFENQSIWLDLKILLYTVLGKQIDC